MAIVSIMKESIRASSEEYYEKLYMNQKQNLSFSHLFKNFCLKGDEIELDELRVIVSSPDYEFLLHLYNGLQSKKGLNTKDTNLFEENSNGRGKKITSSAVIFRTLSPLLIEDEKKIPIAPDDPNYENISIT